jgi:predicted RNase H-like nuclease (RuvC/YqgF family)
MATVKDKVKCPVCRQDSVLPSGGASNFKTNDYALALAIEGSDQSYCTVCSSTEQENCNALEHAIVEDLMDKDIAQFESLVKAVGAKINGLNRVGKRLAQKLKRADVGLYKSLKLLSKLDSRLVETRAKNKEIEEKLEKLMVLPVVLKASSYLRDEINNTLLESNVQQEETDILVEGVSTLEMMIVSFFNFDFKS